jgi:serine O-acetyltransferase
MMLSDDIRSILSSGPMVLRYGEMSPLKFRVYTLVMLVLNPGVLAVALYRLSSWLAQQPLPGRYLAVIVDRLNVLISGCQLPAAAELGPGLQIVHPQAVIIAPNTVAGKNLRVAGASVTIGWSDVDGDPGTQAVTIVDNVIVGAGAKLLGPIHVGDGAQIGPNVVLMEDVPPGSNVISSARAKILNLKPETQDEAPAA